MPSTHSTKHTAVTRALLALALLAEPLSSQDAALLAPSHAIRVEEAHRLVEAVQDSVWPDGWRTSPFALLLVDDSREYLLGFPRIPAGFVDGGRSPLLGSNVLHRKREFSPNLLATFPAFGPPAVIVVGTPEATNKISTSWVLTVLHERFHQYQMAAPGYYDAVAKLDLSRGDQSGMWMLNFAFPYESPAVIEAYSQLSRRLHALLQQSSPEQRREFWQQYAEFTRTLSESDHRYMSFQLWQEGVARYVELRAAQVAASYTPSPEFIALPDYTPFSSAADAMRVSMLNELANPDLSRRRRVSFYAMGAGMAMLLDLDAPDWKRRYLAEPFFLERYLARE